MPNNVTQLQPLQSLFPSYPFSIPIVFLSYMEEEKKFVSREEWRKEMRKTFCKKDMIDEEGNLVKEYPFLFGFTAQVFSFEKIKDVDLG